MVEPATVAKVERAISGYPFLTMYSKAGRSNCCLMSLDAKVYAVSKSPRRKASSCFRTGSLASFGAGACACAGSESMRRRSTSPMQCFIRIQPCPLTLPYPPMGERGIWWPRPMGGALSGVALDDSAVYLEAESRPLRDLDDSTGALERLGGQALAEGIGRPVELEPQLARDQREGIRRQRGRPLHTRVKPDGAAPDVRVHRDAPGIGESGDAGGLREASARADVGLEDVHAAPRDEVAEAEARVLSLSARDRHRERALHLQVALEVL